MTNVRYVTCDPLSSSRKGAMVVGAAGQDWANDAGRQTAGPTIRIFTLGRFSITVDRHAVRSKGKARHRPLGLLQALLALGGRDVAASRLCECLWPDSEGDLAGRNLNITVHRLRQFLQARSAVLQHDGKLSLNEQFCSVDAWDFERLVNSGLDGLGAAAKTSDPEAQLRAALGLYSGHFLARESDEAWMLAARLRLRSKFERLVTALSEHLEHHMRFADAIEICQRALELDPLNELLYRRLMGCYLKRGEIASALATYLRCREALARGLSAPVSSDTARLYLQALHAAERTPHANRGTLIAIDSAGRLAAAQSVRGGA
jgi:LuxR family maltose regulon positive regulatory protein